ncbi:MAG: 16S rRNA (guanine(966)-N(2))-methyltransferase RsmD, partial [Deltaproteobacteria bacterium]|nr:16S rRNA (guanine(966)-N(2))-methyltransferase RsmD [Deltaproteobacteria bacterium]
PRGQGTRPTTDRVREALFSILGPPPPGTRVLDLFAGAGTLGLEALSRGAEFAHFIERDRQAVRCVQSNIAELGFQDRARVTSTEVRRFLTGAASAFGWVFLDPPYRGELAEETLEVLGDGRWLASDCTVVVEHDRRRELPETTGVLEKSQVRRYGDTSLSMYRQA